MKKELFRKGIALGMSLVLAAGTIAVADYHVAASKSQKIATEQVNKTAAASVNILDYAANPSATEYSVSDVEGMEKLAELVNSGTEDFTGKTVKMTDNIYFDKSQKNNHVPIGNGKHYFEGIFDGDNHVVSGMQITINQSHVSEDVQSSTVYGDRRQSVFVGLFGVTGGKSEIKNIRMKNSEIKHGKIDDSFLVTYFSCALLAGLAQGKIANCHIDAVSELDIRNNNDKRKVVYYYLASIAGACAGVVQSCTNGASVKADVSVRLYAYMGGIVGSYPEDEFSAVVEEPAIQYCYNYGNVTHEQRKEDTGGFYLWLGGIMGGFGCTIEECVNAGNITNKCIKLGEHVSMGISGISGGTHCNDSVNCYNTGKITAPKDITQDRTRVSAAGITALTMYNSINNKLYNTYNVGTVSGDVSASIYALQPESGSGGGVARNCDFRYCYWLSGTSEKGYVCRSVVPPKNQDLNECTQKQMQAQSFVDQLNANSISLGYGEVWQADTEGINNGYPILKNVPYSAITQGSDAIVTEDPEEGTSDTTEVAHFFTDYTRSRAATKSTVRIYANGGSVAVAGTKEKKNYKSCILYTDILASYKYSMSAKGKLSLATGKVIVGTTTTDEIPTLQKGKIVDKEAAKIAAASIKHGQITVTAKNQSGKVYLWAIDTGDAGVTACIPVTVKMAPSKLELYSVSDTDSSFSGTGKAYRTAKIKPGSSTKVYLYPSYKDGKTFKKTSEATYTVSVDSKALPYFAVSKLPDSPYDFEISAKKLKNGKSVTGKIVFTCNQNGKKVIFNATAIK